MNFYSCFALSPTSYRLLEINSSLQNIAYTLGHASFLNSQLFAAVVGAALGLLPFLYLVYKDRPIIKVEVSHGLFFRNSITRNVLITTIKNSGNRSVNIRSFFLKFKNGESLIFTDDSVFMGGKDLPKKLDEKNSYSVNILAEDIAQGIAERKEFPRYACFSDALGKIYKHKVSVKYWNTLFGVKESEVKK